jgi:peroxiredoxin
MAKNNELNVDNWVAGRLAKLDPQDDWQPDVARARVLLDERHAVERAAGRKASWAVLAVLAGCAGVLAFPAPREIAQRCVGACESLFVKRPDVAHVAVAVQAAPDFSLTDSLGSDLRLSAYRGKVVLLNFWATWCPPCKAEIPWFEEFQRTYSNQGLVVIGISMDEGGWKAVRPYIESTKINYRIAIGSPALTGQYGGVESLPETLLIDREGRIAARHIGIVKKADYENEIVYLLRK